MKATYAGSLFSAVLFFTFGVWAGPPHRFTYLENACANVKAGREIPSSMWEAVQGEFADALSHPEVLARIDLADLSKSSIALLGKDFALSTTADIVAQHRIASVLERGVPCKQALGQTVVWLRMRSSSDRY